ncbi:cell wall hydrolase SleB [Novosphingobium sp. Rr 2-17]|nr:cell wall hydrolase SleB [Novosphingobium sp. Rr 2-17]
MPKMIESPFAPKSLRPLSAQEAVAWNAKIASSKFAIQVASPLSIAGGAGTSFSRSLQCMTAAVYYEASSEPTDGQRAVAQVVLNRLRHPQFPHTVCGVVYQGSERPTGCQFSFTCDGSLQRMPSPEGWRRAEGVAAAALAGSVYAPVGWATHYHADYVVPYWAPSLQKLATVGHHIFYRWSGAAGEGGSFTSRYLGSEPTVAGMPQTDAQLIQGEALLLDAGAAKRVSAAERPLIEAAPTPAPTASRSTPAQAAENPTASDDRWIIGTPPTH